MEKDKAELHGSAKPFFFQMDCSELESENSKRKDEISG